MVNEVTNCKGGRGMAILSWLTRAMFATKITVVKLNLEVSLRSNRRPHRN